LSRERCPGEVYVQLPWRPERGGKAAVEAGLIEDEKAWK